MNICFFMRQFDQYFAVISWNGETTNNQHLLYSGLKQTHFDGMWCIPFPQEGVLEPLNNQTPGGSSALSIRFVLCHLLIMNTQCVGISTALHIWLVYNVLKLHSFPHLHIYFQWYFLNFFPESFCTLSRRVLSKWFACCMLPFFFIPEGIRENLL